MIEKRGNGDQDKGPLKENGVVDDYLEEIVLYLRKLMKNADVENVEKSKGRMRERENAELAVA
ncbi:hypothetical protein SESBI_06560 [Sesbania bispinosa]|nr:hypothetical protein SESBI_06560 [Sesbania bispinosa]